MQFGSKSSGRIPAANLWIDSGRRRDEMSVFPRNPLERDAYGAVCREIGV